MVAIVAAVGVDVVPVADTFTAKLAAKLLPQAANLGNNLGKTMGQQIASGVSGGVSNGTRAANPGAAGAKAGADYGSAFARMIKTRLEAALRNLPDAQINADSSDAERAIASIRAQMAELRDAHIGVDLSDEEALREIYELQARLEHLRTESASIQVDVDTGKALAELVLLRRELAKVDSRHRVDIDPGNVNATRGALQNLTGSLGLVSAESATSNLAIIGLGSAGAALAPLIVPAATAAAGAIALISVAAVAAGAAIGVLVLVFAPILKAITALNTESTSAGASAGNLANKQLAVAAAADSIRTAERNLASTRIENARDAQAAERGVSDAREALALATRKVGDAERDVVTARRQYADALDAVTTAQRGVTDAQDAVVDARNRVTDADYNLTQAQNAVTDSEYALGQAQQRVIDAQADVVRADHQVIEAEHAVANAQQDSLDAQQGLTDARKDATRAMEDLNNQVIDGALDERSARVRVTQALLEYRKTLADGRANAADREAALISYQEAVQRYSELQQKNARLAEDKAASDAKGVEGSDQVVAAQKRIADTSDAVVAAQDRLTQASAAAAAAQRAVADAQHGVTTAERGVTDAQHGVVAAQQQVAAAKKGVAKAEQEVVDAQKGVVRAQRDAADAQQGIADAQRNVGDAQRGVVHAQRDLADAVQHVADVQRQSADRMLTAQQQLITAQRSMTRALNDTGSSGSAALNKVGAAMANLSPAGKKFVAFIRGDMKGVFKELSFAGQEGLLPGLMTALNIARPLIPIFVTLISKVSKAMGDLSIQAARTFTSPFWKQFFTFLGNVIGPNLQWMTTLGLAVAKMFAVLFRAFEPVGRQMGQALAGLAVKAGVFLAAWVKTPAFQKFVQYMVTNSPLLAQLLFELLKVLVAFGIALAPLAPIIAKILIAFLDWIARANPTKLAAGVFVLAASLAVIAGIAGSLGLVLVLAVVAIVALAAAFVRLYTTNRTFRRITDEVVHAVAAGWKWLWGTVLKPTFLAIGAAALWLWHHAILPAGRGIAAATHALGTAWDWLWKNVVKPVTAFLIDAWQRVWDVIGPLVKILIGLFKNVFGPILLFVIGKVVLPILKLLWLFIKNVLGPIFLWLFHHVVKPILALIGVAFQVAWVIIRIVLALLTLAIRGLAAVFLWLWQHGVYPVWKWIAEHISKIWREKIMPVLRVFGGFIKDHVVPVFKSALAAIGRIWDNLVNMVKAPVSFIVRVVINKGIIDGFNAFVGLFDKKLQVKHIHWPPPGWAQGGVARFSRGGVVPGYEPGVDRHPAMLSGGEGILVPQATRQIGEAQILAWNAAARRGQRLPGFARGGVFASPGGGIASLVPQLTAFAHRSGVPFKVTSGLRTTADYHGRGMAVDMASSAANMVKLARWLYARSRQELELIHSGGGGFFVKNGLRKPASFYRKEIPAHYNHVHLAMNAAGLLGRDISKGGKDTGSGGGGFFDFLGGLTAKVTAPVTAAIKTITGMTHGVTAFGQGVLAVAKKGIRAVVNRGASLLTSPLAALFGGGDNLSNTASSPAAHAAQVYARSQFAKYGWGIGQVQPLVSLWNGESGWNVHARNPSSGAYGIPQALPASKLATAGSDWQNNYKTQVDWGLRYIKERYGAPSNAFAKWTDRSPHWYDDGGYLPQGLSVAMNGTGRRERILNPDETRAWENRRDGSMTLRVIVDDGKVTGLVRVEIDEALGSLADAHVYSGVS